MFTIDPVSGNYVLFPSLDRPESLIIVSGEMLERVEVNVSLNAIFHVIL